MPLNEMTGGGPTSQDDSLDELKSQVNSMRNRIQARILDTSNLSLPETRMPVVDQGKMFPSSKRYKI